MRSATPWHWIALVLALGACAAPRAPGSAVGPAPPRHRGDDLPGGITCLLRLQQLGIAHDTLPRLAGVITPVEVRGAIGGIEYRPTGRRPLRCDCRLALALHRAAPLLRAHGVQVVYYSNAYRRSPKRGKLSRHAMGLAIDVHRLRVAGALLDVAEDFSKGYADAPCEEAPSPLNAVACELRARSLFDRVLTPDTDAAHRDHLHLAVLSFERRRVPARRRPYPVIRD